MGGTEGGREEDGEVEGANLEALARVRVSTCTFVEADNNHYIEVAGGSHSSAGRENIAKAFAFLGKQRTRRFSHS